MNQKFLRLGVVLCLFVATRVLADDWPQWRGPNRNGISREKGWLTNWPAEGPQQLWKANVGTGYSAMSVSKGKLFTMGNTEDIDIVYCLDAKTGKEIWKHTYPCPAKDPNGYPGTRCTPTVDADRVYTVSRQGQFFCLNVADGKVLWSKDYAKDFKAPVPEPGANQWWGYAGSPLIEKEVVIFETGAPGASVVACNKKTGDVVWKNGDDGVGYSSIVAFTYKGDRCLAVFCAPGIVGRSAKDGKELWRHPWKTSYNVNAATPIIDGDKVFISSGYNTGCALIQFSETPPKVLWQNKNMRNHVNSSVLWKDHLYGFDEKELRCLDFKTGEVKWSEKSFGKGSLMLADGKLIIFSDAGKLAVAEPSPDAYKELSAFQALGGKNTWTVPTLANGKIYCRSWENLVCLDVSGK
jgi:outer membrane protein assembly factor BamB